MNARLCAVLVLAVISSGCVCAPAPCSKDSECSAGQSCRDAQCLAPCSATTSCAAGTTCSDGFCRAACQSSGSCSGDQACAGGVCRPKTCGGTTCAPDNVCIDGQCTSVACAGVVCASGQQCANGTCYATNCGGTPCGNGQVCISAVCTDAACVGVICPANTTCLSGACLSPGDALPYSLVCEAMARGYKNTFNSSTATCTSGAVGADDLAHQPFISIGGGTTSRPTTSTLQLLSSLFTCGPGAIDAGFFSLALAPLEESIDAGRVAYDGLKARACINAGYGDAGISPACNAVFTPLVTPGGVCSRTEECPNDHFCKPSGPATCAGTCVPRLADNAPCEPSRELCQSGSCTLNGTVYRCQPLTTATDGGSGPGTDCAYPGSTSTCSPVLRCVRNTGLPALPDGGPGGTCTAAVGLGLSCGVQPALGPACTGSCLTCVSTDGMTGLCKARGASGASCRVDGDCDAVHLCLGGFCAAMAKPGEACVTGQNGARGSCLWGDNYCRQGAADAGTGTCTGLPDLNQACGSRFDLTDVCARGSCTQGTCQADPTQGQPCSGLCAGALLCESRDAGPTVCSPRHQAGDSCFSTSDCDTSLRCLTNVCVARFAAGSVCTQNEECLSSNCTVVGKVCAETCFSSLTPGQTYLPGCAGGLRDWAILLAYSSLGLVWAGRKKKRG